MHPSCPVGEFRASACQLDLGIAVFIEAVKTRQSLPSQFDLIFTKPSPDARATLSPKVF
jgi:hypothetical protein